MFKKSLTYQESIKNVASTISEKGGTVLVTGASGLIGTCIVDALVSANLYFGKHFQIYAIGRNADKLFGKFGSNPDIHCVAHDISEPISISGIDYIIHAASNADPSSYALYPVETILTNVLGAKNVLDYCRNNNTRALLTSSFEVNGKLEQDEYSENDYGIIDLNMIRSCYPESKRTAELLFRSYYDEYEVDCVIARLPSVYGPTMQSNDSKAQAQFLRNAISGEDIVLKSKGTPKRTYCYVMDAISGLLTVLFTGKSGEIYNVANGNSIATIAEVAQTIADISGQKVIFDLPNEIEKKGFSKPQNCILKSEKVKALGWNGRYTLKKGMEETIQILKEL